MGKVSIKARDNGPYVIKGAVDLLDGEDKLIETACDIHICRCGLSAKFPYCTGAHKNKFKNEVRSE